ncbi:quinone oxidoreductase [Acidobacteria bacterium AH-259-L09]|nr:quinone oxidoreductase [Acidobacteria bacterium AH-259-L09]
MKAIRVHEPGGPEVLSYEDVPEPEPNPNEALVEIKAIGLNFIDTYHRTGLYKAAPPFTPGVEAAGTVSAVGSDVSEVEVGDPVAYALSLGTYAERAAVPAWQLVKLPPDVDFKTGAAIMVQGMTAHYLTRSSYPLAPGRTALVHAAAGGVGLLLVQMAKMCGARVIGTVSTEEKAELAGRAGADEVILYTEKDFESEVQRLTDGGGVEVVYDSVGQTTFEKGLNCLKPRGYLVLFGQASGPVPPFDPQILNAKGSLFLTRPSLGHYAASREELLERAGEILKWVSSGDLKVRIDRTFPLSEASDSHRALEGRKTAGKVLLLP